VKRKIPLLRDESSGELKNRPHVVGKVPRLTDSSLLCHQFSSSNILKKYPQRQDAPPIPASQTEVLKLVPRPYQVYQIKEQVQNDEHNVDVETTDECEVDGVVYDHIESLPHSSDLFQEIDFLEEEPDFEGTQWDEPDDLVLRKCKSCGVVAPQLEMLEHVRAFHRQCTQARGFPPRPGGNLWCPYPHCKVLLYNYEYLIAHLVGFHAQEQYKREEIVFNNDNELELWRQRHEAKEGKLFEGNEEIREYAEDGSHIVKINKIFCCEKNSETMKKATHDHIPRLPHVSCPFLVSIERLESGLIILSGTFAHLGHKKSVPMMLTPKGILKPEKVRLTFREFRCHPCRRVFPDASTLQYHQRLRHGVISMLGGPCRRPNITCAECPESFDSMPNYIAHVKVAHLEPDEKMNIETHVFQNNQEFEEWKLKVETMTCAQFVCTSGKVRPKNNLGTGTSHQYLQCYRSGHQSKFYRSDEPARRRKSKKINAFCTAFINIAETYKGQISVKCCLYHFGHDNEPENLPVSKGIKGRIEELLRNCMDFDRIRDVIVAESQPNERGFYLKKYEVVNVAKKLVKTEPFLILNNKLVPDSENIIGKVIEDTNNRNRCFPRGFDSNTRLLLRHNRNGADRREEFVFTQDGLAQELHDYSAPSTSTFDPTTKHSLEPSLEKSEHPVLMKPRHNRNSHHLSHSAHLNRVKQIRAALPVILETGVVYDPRAPSMEIKPSMQPSKKVPLLMLPEPSADDSHEAQTVKLALQEIIDAQKYERDAGKSEELYKQRTLLERKIVELLPQTKNGNRLVLEVPGMPPTQQYPKVVQMEENEPHYAHFDAPDYETFVYHQQDIDVNFMEAIHDLGEI
ncbi:unnamed protein product, partial [Mesorhabditis belari]